MTIDTDYFDLTGSEALKAVFRNHATGISIVTSTDAEGNPIGFTASSVTSLGSVPPLVSLNIAQGASTYQHVRPGKLLAIHTLDADNLALAQKLAAGKEGRFADNDFGIGPESTPIFLDASSVLLARVVNKIEVEANALVVLSAESAHQTRSPKEPLVYFQRGYHTVGDRLIDNF
ncbi:MAG: flavin reductase family protein [Aquiluna sp.]|nr:flavin reductase family protein [Aquiluna sp.]